MFAKKPAAAVTDPPPHSALSYGFVTYGLPSAFADGCRRLGLRPVSEPMLNEKVMKSCGGRVQSAAGAISWLKVSGIPRGCANEMRDREAASWAIAGVPMPKLIEYTDWTADGIEWRAVRSTLVSSPSIKENWLAGDRSLASDDRWIASLRNTFEKVAALSTTYSRRSQDYVAGAIMARFGADAPGVASEWQCAHGDPNWANITVPDATLFDWETWGLAPRAYDAAYLMVGSYRDYPLMERLYTAFEDEFSTPSGCVGLLLASAEMLNQAETINGFDPEHRRRIDDIAQRALRRNRKGIG
jgi:hypothetical protein